MGRGSWIARRPASASGSVGWRRNGQPPHVTARPQRRGLSRDTEARRVFSGVRSRHRPRRLCQHHTTPPPRFQAPAPAPASAPAPGSRRAWLPFEHQWTWNNSSSSLSCVPAAF
ncbi:hypothetical protein VTN02DRAFT_5361 [Thermoascus thermophilus]